MQDARRCEMWRPPRADGRAGALDAEDRVDRKKQEIRRKMARSPSSQSGTPIRHSRAEFAASLRALPLTSPRDGELAGSRRTSRQRALLCRPTRRFRTDRKEKRDLLRTKPREASPPRPRPLLLQRTVLVGWRRKLCRREARWVLLRRDLAALQAQVGMLTERAAAGYDAEQREHERGRSRPETLAAAARTTTSPRHGSDLQGAL